MIDCLTFMERNGKRIFYTSCDAEYRTLKVHMYQSKPEDIQSFKTARNTVNIIISDLKMNRRKQNAICK